MARINIEDSLFRDTRFLNLCVKLGSPAVALGEIVFAYIEAQKFHLKNGAIPESVWADKRLNYAIIEVGLAEVTPKGVRIKGQDEAFKWLVSASAGGSKKSPKKLKNLKQNNRSDFGAKTEVRPKSAEALTPTPTLTLNLTPTPDQVTQNLKNEFNQVKPDSPMANEVIGLYYNLWKEKYGSKPPLTGKHFSLIKNIVKTNGVDRTSELLKAYFQMPDAYFIKRRHDVESFNGNLNQIAHFGDTGTVITNQQVRQADSQMANQQLLKSYERKTK